MWHFLHVMVGIMWDYFLRSLLWVDSMHVSTHVQMHGCGVPVQVCTHACEGQRATLDVVFRHSLPCFIKKGFLVGLNSPARLAGYQAPGIYLSLLTQCWGLSSCLHTWFCIWVLRFKLRSLIELSLQSSWHFLFVTQEHIFFLSLKWIEIGVLG